MPGFTISKSAKEWIITNQTPGPGKYHQPFNQLAPSIKWHQTRNKSVDCMLTTPGPGTYNNTLLVYNHIRETLLPL